MEVGGKRRGGVNADHQISGWAGVGIVFLKTQEEKGA